MGPRRVLCIDRTWFSPCCTVPRNTEPGSTWHAEHPEFEDATSELAPGTSKRPSPLTHTPTTSMLGNSGAIWFGPRAGVARLPLHSMLCSGVGVSARSGETHYRGVWSGEPAQSRCTTPPLCSGRARTTAGDLPPPLGALCPRKGYPSGKDERLASHPGELRRLSRLNEAAILNLGTGGGHPLAA